MIFFSRFRKWKFWKSTKFKFFFSILILFVFFKINQKAIYNFFFLALKKKKTISSTIPDPKIPNNLPRCFLGRYILFEINNILIIWVPVYKSYATKSEIVMSMLLILNDLIWWLFFTNLNWIIQFSFVGIFKNKIIYIISH